MELTHEGHLWLSGALSHNSDIRITKKIEDIDDKTGSEKILWIEPKTYKNINEDRGTEKVIGFIAQQIKEIIPEAVDVRRGDLPNGDETQDCYHLNKTYIFTLNVCATQELHRMITRQQAIMDSLISRIEVLENQ